MITDENQIDDVALQDLKDRIAVYTYVDIYDSSKNWLYTLGPDDLATSDCYITEGTSEAGILIGNVITKELHLKVFTNSHVLHNGYIISVTQTIGTAGITRGNSISKGEYVITSIETSKGFTEITAYDYMYNADEIYTGTTSDTVYDSQVMVLTTVISDICNQIGCVCDSSSNVYDFDELNGNQSNIVGFADYSPRYVLPEGATCKELLQSMAVMCCANVRIDGNNTIQFIRNGNGTYCSNSDLIVDLTDNMDTYGFEIDDKTWAALDGTMGSFIIPDSTIKFAVGKKDEEDDESNIVSYYWNSDFSEDDYEDELPTSLPSGISTYYELSTVISMDMDYEGIQRSRMIALMYIQLIKQILSRFTYSSKYSYYYLIYAFEITMPCNPLIECWDFINIINNGDNTFYSYINEITYNFMGITTIKNTSS